jgi:N-acylneuraminate cytidylyltransferase
MRIVVSTDSKEYGIIAQQHGAEVPFIRPDNISGDLSTDYEFLSHAVSWFLENENYRPDIILQLRPTSPLRKVEDIDDCLSTFISNMQNYDSLRSVIPFDKSPYKMYTIEGNTLTPLFTEVNNIMEPYNQCRQVLPQCFLHNGYIDILKTSIIDKGTISGERIYPFVMSPEDNLDIDTEKDFKKVI